MKTVISLLVLAGVLTTLGACARRAPVIATTPISPEAQGIYHVLLADQLVRESREEEALEVLRKVLSEHPTEELYLETAGLAWRLQRFPEALATLRDGAERFPHSRGLRIALAQSLANRGRHADAAATMEEFLRLHPEDIEVRLRAAAHIIDAGQPHKVPDILRPIPSPERDARYFFLQGKALVRQGQVGKGIDVLERAAQLDPDAAEIWVEMAMAYEQIRNWTEAERILSELIRLGKGNDALAFHVLELNLRMGRPDKGLATFLDSMPSLTTQLDAAQLLMDQGLLDHAAAIIDPLTTDEDVSVEVRLAWAMLEARRKNHAKALAILQPISEEDPQAMRAQILRILILQESGATSQAEEIARKALDRRPQDSLLRTLLAELLEDAGRIQEAEDLLRQGLETTPEDPRLLYRLGILLDNHQRQAEAMAVMERLIAKHPNHADALNYVGYTLAVQGRDLERAEALIRTAISQEPGNGYFVDSLAWVLYQQGKYNQAWKEIQRAVTLADDPVIWEHYGDIAARLDLIQQARRGYTEALRHNPPNAKAIQAKRNSLRGHER